MPNIPIYEQFPTNPSPGILNTIFYALEYVGCTIASVLTAFVNIDATFEKRKKGPELDPVQRMIAVLEYGKTEGETDKARDLRVNGILESTSYFIKFENLPECIKVKAEKERQAGVSGRQMLEFYKNKLICR